MQIARAARARGASAQREASGLAGECLGLFMTSRRIERSPVAALAFLSRRSTAGWGPNAIKAPQLDRHEAESVGRGRGPGVVPRGVAVEQLVERVGADMLAADVDECTDEDAHHMLHEGVAPDLYRHEPFVAVPFRYDVDGLDDAHGRFARVALLSKGSKVVLSFEPPRPVEHRFEIQPIVDTSASLSTKWTGESRAEAPRLSSPARLAGRADLQEVAIGLAVAIESRIVAVGCRCDLDDREIIRQRCVETAQPPVGRYRLMGVERANLPERVYACIRSTRPADGTVTHAHAIEGRFELALRRPLSVLPLPACEIRPVIGHRQAHGLLRHGHSDGWRLERDPEPRGPGDR